MATVASLKMLSLGPVMLPVDVLSSVPAPQSLSNVCCGQGEPHDPVKITMPKTCPTCGVVTDPTALKKAARAGNGWVLVETPTEQKVDNRSIALTPHPKEQIALETMPSGKTYWLKPSKNSDPKPYGLLRGMVEADDKHTYVTWWAVRTKPAMYELSVHGNTLVLVERIHLSDANSAPDVQTASPSETDVKNLLIITESKSEPFSKEKYSDDRMSELLAGGKPVSLGAETGTSEALSDLLAAMASELAAPPKPKRVRKPRQTKSATTSASTIATP